MVSLVLLFWIFFHQIYPIVCHTPKNNSDVIVTYSGHAEANFEREPVQNTTSEPSETSTDATTTKKLKIFIPEYIIDREFSTTEYPIPEEEEVVFIPNEKTPSPRYGDEFPSRNRIRVQDLMEKTVGDVNARNIRIESGTEAPKDIFFISGKNNEDMDSPKQKTETKAESRRSERVQKETEKLNCQNLNCNNTISSVCGGKYEHSEWKYRIFKNECFYRKVNCAFSYQENRYKEVPIEKCKHVGAHFKSNPIIYNPILPIPKPALVNLNLTRRNTISRRSMTKDIDGQGCDHTCPITCPEDYEPECASSSTGNRRVFLNHCKLDYNSCTLSVVWYQRPLSECVGGKKADMRQNRAFIGWMQKVGIVDNKGRLVLS